jgi:chaperonin GroES
MEESMNVTPEPVVADTHVPETAPEGPMTEIAEIIEEGGIEKVVPLYDNVLLEPVKRSTRTQGGLVVPEIVSDEPMHGRILAVGPGRKTEFGVHLAMDQRLQPGKIVVYAKFAGFEIEADRKPYKLVRAEDILAVFE